MSPVLSRPRAAGPPAVEALSVLDLSPVPAGATAAQALRNTLDLARGLDG
jgi:hypothetical protein